MEILWPKVYVGLASVEQFSSFMGFSFFSKVQCIMRPPRSMVGKGAGRWSLTLARTYLYIFQDSTQAKSSANAISYGPQIFFRTGSQSEAASWGPRNIIEMFFGCCFFFSFFFFWFCLVELCVTLNTVMILRCYAMDDNALPVCG